MIIYDMAAAIGAARQFPSVISAASRLLPCRCCYGVSDILGTLVAFGAPRPKKLSGVVRRHSQAG